MSNAPGGIDGREYGSIWRLWKAASLILFAVFVALLRDVACTLRRIERSR